MVDFKKLIEILSQPGIHGCEQVQKTGNFNIRFYIYVYAHIYTCSVYEHSVHCTIICIAQTPLFVSRFVIDFFAFLNGILSSFLNTSELASLAASSTPSVPAVS